MRRLQYAVRLAQLPAVALASLVACGSSDAKSEATETASQAAEARNTPPEGMTPSETAPGEVGEEGGEGKGLGHGAKGALSECSVAQVLGIAQAFNDAEIERAKLGVRMAQDPAVKKHAHRDLEDHQELARELSSLEQRLGVQPARGDIVDAIGRSASAQLRSLQGSQSFDREYMADDISSDLEVVGFLQAVKHAGHGRAGRQPEGAREEGVHPDQGVPWARFAGSASFGAKSEFETEYDLRYPDGTAVRTTVEYPAGAGGEATGGGMPGSDSAHQQLAALYWKAHEVAESDLQDGAQLEKQLVGSCGVAGGECTATARTPASEGATSANTGGAGVCEEHPSSETHGVDKH
jgi:predicted outer membrane protein